MKNYLKVVVLAPCLLAAFCDPLDECGLDSPETYIVNVENISETYAENETIWLRAQTSSKLIDGCTETTEPELITDPEVFIDGLFVLKLNNASELNAQVFTNVAVSYDIGEIYTFNACSNAINYLPELTDDNLYYEYRLGFSIGTPGDYCIVSARDSFFNTDNQNNAGIFDAYNTLDDKIKFENCEDIYTRNGTDGHYFFRIQ